MREGLRPSRDLGLRAARGDLAARSLLLQKMDRLLWKLAGRFTIPGFTIDDLHQEAIYGVLGGIHAYDGSTSPVTFCTVCARNHLLKLRQWADRQSRKQPKLCAIEPLEPYLDDPGSGLGFREADYRIALEQALQEMPMQDAELARRVLIHRETLTEISAEHDRCRQAISNRWAKIRARLRVFFEQEITEQVTP